MKTDRVITREILDHIINICLTVGKTEVDWAQPAMYAALEISAADLRPRPPYFTGRMACCQCESLRLSKPVIAQKA